MAVDIDSLYRVRNLKQGVALPRGFAIWSITLEKKTP
jgi:hypothetical protein